MANNQCFLKKISDAICKCLCMNQIFSDRRIRDKTEIPVSDLSMDDIFGQIKVADEYLEKIMNKELTVDRQTETRAKKRRWVLITASLINQNKYTYY